MTNILRHLPKLDELKRELEANPQNIKYYINYDTYVGPTDSVEYLTNKIKSYENSTNL